MQYFCTPTPYFCSQKQIINSKQKTKMNTIAILELIVGILFLSETLSRITGGETPRDTYYNLCRPFLLKMPMRFSIFITFMETVAGTLLAFHGILMLKGIV